MDLRVDIITLAVPDLGEAHAFYVDRLGWHPELVVPGEVTFLRAGPGRLVGLFGRRDLERDPFPSSIQRLRTLVSLRLVPLCESILNELPVVGSRTETRYSRVRVGKLGTWHE